MWPPRNQFMGTATSSARHPPRSRHPGWPDRLPLSCGEPGATSGYIQADKRSSRPLSLRASDYARLSPCVDGKSLRRSFATAIWDQVGHGLTWPSWWGARPYVAHLGETSRACAGDALCRQALLPHFEDVTTDPKPQARAVAAITAGITPEAVVLAAAKRLCALGLPGPLQDIGTDLGELLNVRGASPHKTMLYVKTILNAWPTLARANPATGVGALPLGVHGPRRRACAVWQVAERRRARRTGARALRCEATRWTEPEDFSSSAHTTSYAPTAPSERRPAGPKRSPLPRGSSSGVARVPP